MAEPSTGQMLGVSGVLTYAGGTYNVHVGRVSGGRQVSQLTYRPRNQTDVRAIDRAVDGFVSFSGEGTQGQATGLTALPASGSGTFTWQMPNGVEESLTVQLRRVTVSADEDRRETTFIAGEFRVVQAAGGTDQTDHDGDGDTYIWAPEVTRQAARQTAIVRGVSSNNAGTHQMVKDAVDNYVSANSTLAGLQIDRAVGRAIAQDAVRISVDYRGQFDVFEQQIVPDLRIRGRGGSTIVDRWKGYGSSPDWLETDGTDPNGLAPQQRREPAIVVYYTTTLSSNPITAYAGVVGKFNSVTFSGAAAKTLLFESYPFQYDPADEVWIVTFQLIWRPLGWTYDVVQRDEADMPIYDTYRRVDLTTGQTASFGTLPTPELI